MLLLGLKLFSAHICFALLMDLYLLKKIPLIFHQIQDAKLHIKTGRLKRSQFTSLFFSSKISRKCFVFLIYILIDYLVHEISKEFWKHSHFENMRAGFLLRCQNWLRWKKNIICLWNIESLKQKLAFGYVIVPKIGQNIILIQHRLLLVRKITI